MDLPTFKQSLDRDAPPEDLGRALAALWHEAKGDWDQAHRLAQGQTCLSVTLRLWGCMFSICSA